MTKEEFLKEMQEVLQTENELSVNTVLNELEDWDSLAIMATMAFLNQSFGIKVSMKDFYDVKTVGDIAQKVNITLL